MSFLERHHLPWLVFVIDGLAIAMVVAIAFLVVQAFPQRETTSFDPQRERQTIPISQKTPADIQTEYHASLRELAAFVAAFDNGSPVDLLKKIQEAMFSMRVPGALRDAHLKAVLTAEQLQGSIAGASSAEAKARLQAIIEGLVGKE